METIEATPTRQVVVDMLCENTGRHMLDSGNHYGRNFETNEGKTADDFDKSPVSWVDDDSATLNVYHYLLENLEYAPDINANFQEFTSKSEDSYYEDMHVYVSDYLGLKEGDLYESGNFQTFNTYNYEGNLSQGLQGVSFNVNDCDYVLLQVHGGCDIRGGYTRPRAFKVISDPYFWARQELTIMCKNRHFFCGSDVEWYEAETGSYVNMSEFKCPTCGAKFIN